MCMCVSVGTGHTWAFTPGVLSEGPSLNQGTQIVVLGAAVRSKWEVKTIWALSSQALR